MGLELRAEKCPWRGDIELLAMVRNGEQITDVAQTLTMRHVEPAEAINHQPTMVLRGHDAQSLMDDLWRCGLRPSEGSGSAGHLAATQKHLEHVSKTHDRILDLIFDKARRDDFDALHRGWQQLEKAQAKQGMV